MAETFKPEYKVGDRLRIIKKPSGQAFLSVGDIVVVGVVDKEDSYLTYRTVENNPGSYDYAWFGSKHCVRAADKPGEDCVF